MPCSTPITRNALARERREDADNRERPEDGRGDRAQKPTRALDEARHEDSKRDPHAEDLGGTEVDVAIAALPERARGVHMTPLYRERTVLVARRNHPRVGARISKLDLASLRHVDVQVAPGRGYRDLPASYARLGIEREVGLVVPSFTTAAAIVAATDFVATLPASLAEVLGERLGIRAVAAPVRAMTIEIKLAWHERTSTIPPCARSATSSRGPRRASDLRDPSAASVCGAE